MRFRENLAQRARNLKAETFALYLAARDPRTPWYAKLFVASVVAYVLSPIDLIPDFVPILGYLDDLVLVPLGIALAIRPIPGPVLDEYRTKAQEAMKDASLTSRTAAAVIIVIWLALAALSVVWAYKAFAG
ncbi:MAG TPA: YkvA family protein [Candidatus Binatia bacterium]|nr:YkvA family protein [Candidatus Binatia bacterium]